jgi:MFS family permease
MRGLRERIPIAGAVFSACLVGFSLSHSLALSMLLLFGVGFGFMTATASCNTLIQATASDEMRGRVMSLYAMAFMGMMPFGSLAAGLLAAWIGAEATVLGSGAATMAAAALFALRLRAMPSGDRPGSPR